jgi:glycosyltransferase involved in cell wall biosynthesis
MFIDALVGVIIPCYSHVDHLSENLDSLLTQTYFPGRIVVVDDCSPRGEEIEAICRDYGVEYLRQLENKGLSEARNTGYLILDGVDYVVALDDDDLIAPGYIELGARALWENPAAWVAYPDTQLFGWESRVWAQPDYSPDLLMRQNYIVCASMWRREAWEAVKSRNGHGYDPHMGKLGGWEDYLFNLEALIGLREGDPSAAIHMGHHKYWFLYRRHREGSMVGGADANRKAIRAYMNEKMRSIYSVDMPEEYFDEWERLYA